MEKRIARIARWLERCARACSARSWQSALMDMECAKAELEEARVELWARAEENFSPSPAVRKAGRAVLAAALGVFLLLSVAGPLAVQSFRETSPYSSGPSLEWVSTDEKALLSALRRSLSDANLAWISAEENGAVPLQSVPAEPVLQADTGRIPAVRPGNKKMTNPSSSGREFDTIITLVQIGQKALMGKESAIRFDGP